MKSSHVFAVVLGLVFLGLAFEIRAESKLGDFTITHWTRDNGLPHNSVTCLAQTRDGFLWVGTGAGLARFDGLKFVPLNFPLAGGRSAIEITALYQEERGCLWIGTATEGLWRLAGGDLTRLSIGGNELTKGITCVCGDPNGSLWVGSTEGLSWLNASNVTVFTVTNGLPSDVVSSVHVSASGTVWITTRKGMCQFKNGRLTPFEFQTDSAGRSPEMIGMYDDRRGNLWAFGDTYLVNLNDGKRFNYFRNGDTASLRIWSLCEGSAGQLWIGTSGQGVFAFSDGRFRPLSLRDATIGSDVQAICEDRDGSLWLGTFTGGLVRLQPRRVQMLDAATGLPSEMATCLGSDAAGRLWAGYAGGGLFANAGDRFEKQQYDGCTSVNLVTSLAAGADGDLWVATLGLGLLRLGNGTIARMTTECGLVDDEVLALAGQKDGALWAGTSSGALQHIGQGVMESYRLPNPAPITCVLAGASNTWVGTEGGSLFGFVNGRFKSADASGVLSRAPVRALCEDSSGHLWIGTEGNGLACFAAGHLRVWDTKAGLPANEVNGLVLDDGGVIWLSTRQGIYRMPRFDVSQAGTVPALQLVSEYDHAVPFSRRGWPQAVKSPDGRLWFAGPNAICVVDPRDFHVLNQMPPVSVGPVIVNGRPAAFADPFAEPAAARTGKPLRFPSALRTLEIEFTTPSLDWPDRVQFQHRLDNFDNEWVDGGSERRVRYSGLPFGQYQFRVRARGLDGTWGKENTALVFDLPVPLWRSPLAVGGAAALAAVAVAGLVRFISHRRLRLKLAQLGHQQELERERMRIARDMHDEIGSKLTRISYLSELALQDETPSRQNVFSIAQTIRGLLQTVDEIVWAVDPQNDTLENLATYLGHYATEYLQSTSVECVLNIPPDLPVQPLTAETRHNLFLAFEEAVSNALKHSGATRLRIDMEQKNESFEISIQDNGRGFEPTSQSGPRNGETAWPKRKGHGLTNMKQRLAALGGEAGIESKPGQGTTVAFTFPVSRTIHE
jgi:signal transduction histidine kinase/ligand-binding sensor domain-containing protein